MIRELPFANRVVEECESTNDLARQLAEAGYPHSTWVAARTQTNGRGRLGRTWQSLEGNLFLSIVIRNDLSTRWSWIPLASALGVLDAVRAAYPSAKLGVKWPNDLICDDAKLGGLLCEGVSGASGEFVVVGIGLNCKSSPDGLDQETISLSKHLDKLVTADEIRPRVVQYVIRSVNEMLVDGPSVLKAAYDRYTVLRPGSAIEWHKRVGDQLHPIPERGRVLGLGDSSQLQVLLPHGEQIELFAEDVKISR